MKTVCIIGAGTAGLCAARHALENRMLTTVFEQTNEIGGTWVYNDNTGKDEYGIDIHSSMYKGLHTNLPKEIMGYPDFPIPDQEKSYIPAEDILKFLNLYTDSFHLRKNIKFLHHVIRVTHKNDHWEVIIKDLLNGSVLTEVFDFVLVCNGHYHTPAYANIDGMASFTGTTMHSHDYRSPECFQGETVLVIGAGPSGMDLAYEISKHANKVVLSHHLAEMPKSKFPKNVVQKTDVLRMYSERVEFLDGTFERVSLIVHCTGYKYAFPFLNIHCGIHVDDNYVKPLYKHCININLPTMAFIGLPFYVCASQMMDLQARFVLQFFSGNRSLPSREEMILDTRNEMEERWKRGYKKRQAHMMGPDQEKYYNDLSTTAGIENLKPVISKLHNESSTCFLNNLVNFRKEIFKIIDDDTFLKVNENCD